MSDLIDSIQISDDNNQSGLQRIYLYNSFFKGKFTEVECTGNTNNTGSNGAGKTSLSAQDIVARWSMSEDSNGETTIDFITSLSNLEGCLIVLDEPETSLSIKSQIKMRNLVKRLAEKNQIIVVTHSQYFMEMSKDIYDFEKKQWTSTVDYIKSQIK